jgi:AcrR family transcriptional regulator
MRSAALAAAGVALRKRSRSCHRPANRRNAGMSLPPRRLPPEAARDAALEAARALLVEDGPSAVTLKAVAARIGRTHANLLHHFGSAAGLQKALIARMAGGIVRTIGEGGAGALASWMILSGNTDALDPILTAIHDLVEELAENDPPGNRPIKEQTLTLVLMALGDALMGESMARALALPRDKARELALEALIAPDIAPA